MTTLVDRPELVDGEVRRRDIDVDRRRFEHRRRRARRGGLARDVPVLELRVAPRHPEADDGAGDDQDRDEDDDDGDDHRRHATQQAGVLASGPAGGAAGVRHDAGGVEGELDAGPQLPCDPPLLVRRGLDDEPDRDRVERELLDTPDLGRGEDLLGPGRVLGERERSLRDHLLGAVDVGAVRDRDVEHHARPLLRLVADARDRPVRDVPDDAFDVAQARRAQRDVLDGAGRETEVDDVADADLVLHDHERAVDEVAQQVLRAERERDADEARAREHRGARRSRTPTGSAPTATTHTMIDVKLASPRAIVCARSWRRVVGVGALDSGSRRTRRPPTDMRLTLLSHRMTARRTTRRSRRFDDDRAEHDQHDRHPRRQQLRDVRGAGAVGHVADPAAQPRPPIGAARLLDRVLGEEHGTDQTSSSSRSRIRWLTTRLEPPGGIETP